MSLSDRVASRVDALFDGLIDGATGSARAIGAVIVAVAVAGMGWVGLLGASSQSPGGLSLPPEAVPVGSLGGSWPAGTGPWVDTPAWATDPADAVSLSEPTTPLRISAPRVSAALADQPPVVATLVDVARRHGVDPHLVVALAWHESRWDPTARSSEGAVGVLQVKPSTVEQVSEEIGRPLAPRDPADNATAGVVYLSWLLGRFDTTRDALIAYNQGTGALRQHGPYPSATWFADVVLATRAAFAKARWAPQFGDGARE